MSDSREPVVTAMVPSTHHERSEMFEQSSSLLSGSRHLIGYRVSATGLGLFRWRVRKATGQLFTSRTTGTSCLGCIDLLKLIEGYLRQLSSSPTIYKDRHRRKRSTSEQRR